MWRPYIPMVVLLLSIESRLCSILGLNSILEAKLMRVALVLGGVRIKGHKGKIISLWYMLILVGPNWRGVDQWCGSILFDPFTYLLLTDDVVAFDSTYIRIYYWLMMWQHIIGPKNARTLYAMKSIKACWLLHWLMTL